MIAIADKYNIPAPRYTSYPTVPFWQDDAPDQSEWLESVKTAYYESGILDGISLYIHLPYCESLCTYCGCNKRITKNHSVEDAYIHSLLNEWRIYSDYLGEKIKIKEIHLGGGTPTFFSPNNLKLLINGLKDRALFSPKTEMSFEGHPNNTTFNHLLELANVGFNRVSYGIQDFNPQVQKAINRIQPIENVKKAYENARQLGYESVNFDLVYGLPFQNLDSINNTIKTLENFMPDRIALYSYAHVPWKSPSQRGYSEADLPDPTTKSLMYEKACINLLEMGYIDIGMDHFALPTDSLAIAYKAGRLNRNFMGYTTTNSQIMIGIGCSSISDSSYAFVQNEKNVEKYKVAVNEGRLPLIKGHFMKGNDRAIREFIKELICNAKADAGSRWYQLSDNKRNFIYNMIEDKLLTIDGSSLSMTQKGRAFVRLVCMQFDEYLAVNENAQNMFSKAV